MTEIVNLGRDIELSGKSGIVYHGKIYDKESENNFAGQAIVVLSNSSYEGKWHHNVNAIYMTDNAEQAFVDFQKSSRHISSNINSFGISKLWKY